MTKTQTIYTIYRSIQKTASDSKKLFSRNYLHRDARGYSSPTRLATRGATR